MSVKNFSHYKQFAVVSFFMVLLMFSSKLVVKSQDDAPPQITGRTRTVSLTPWGAVDAGPFIFSMDSDHDGISDEEEAKNGTDPNNSKDADLDPDGDGLTNGDESTLKTNPKVADTDGDGYSDGEEVRRGYDPLDPSSHPSASAQVVQISVTPDSMGFQIGGPVPVSPVQITVTGKLSDGSTVDLTNTVGTTYQSLDTTVAKVDSAGSVVGLAVGVTSISIRNGDLAETVPVVVSKFNNATAVINMPGFANNVDVSGNFAYVACGSAGLQIADITNFVSARIVGSVTLPGNANDVRVVGNYAYVASGSAGLQIVDISNPTSPRLVGGTTFSEAVDVVVRGNYAYVAAAKDGFKIVDVSNPSSPTVVGSLTFTAGTSVEGLDVNEKGEIAVLAISGSSSLAQAIDITNPAVPQIRDSVTMSYSISDVAIKNSLAYVAGAVGITVVDIITPDSLKVVGQGDTSFNTVDIEIQGNVAATALARQFTAIGASTPFFSLTDPVQPHYTGLITGGPFRYCIGIAMNKNLVLFTTSRTDMQNGDSGDTALVIGQYNSTDTNGVKPTAQITAPSEGEQVIAGDKVSIKISATDDVAVAAVEIKASGTVISTLKQSPYETTFTIPSTVGSEIKLEAKALDTAGNIGEATPVKVKTVTDPMTTVIGKVTDLSDTPVSGATVKLSNSSRTTTTDSDGKFSFSGVGTIPSGISVSVFVQDTATSTRGQSAQITPVRGGTTDLGIVKLAAAGTTPLPSPVTAIGVGYFDTEVGNDLFVGFSDRSGKVYFSGADGKLTPSTSFTLPFDKIRSGTAVRMQWDSKTVIVAQAIGDSGNVYLVTPDETGKVKSTEKLSTGLTGESEFIASGEDWSDRRPVLAFLQVAGGTVLTVRIGDGAGGLDAPINLSVDSTIPLRSPILSDLDGDGLVDLVLIKEVSAVDTRIVVYPRTSATTFGSPIESPIITRSVSYAFGTNDYGMIDLDGNLVMLGDDRLRIYKCDRTGKFSLEREIDLPTGSVPLGIGSYTGLGTIAVVVKNVDSSRSLLVYNRIFSDPPDVFKYDTLSDSTSVRVLVDYFVENGATDVVVIDENSNEVFPNVGNSHGGT